MNVRTTLMVALAFSLAPASAGACTAGKALEGTLSIPQCEPAKGKTCINGGRAVYEASQAYDVPGEFSIALQTSPWRMYDGDGRIFTIEELAGRIRNARPATDTSVRLIGSWTSARPDGAGSTLAKRLSVALDGVPVTGSGGFLWLSAKGGLRTTRQAYSIWKAGHYKVDPGADVFVPLVPGAMVQFEDDFARDGEADGVVQAGIGNDVFMLCPERALAAFERAGGMGNAIGAYNAGLMHADAGKREQAIAWLEKASKLGEAKAAEALARVRRGSATTRARR